MTDTQIQYKINELEQEKYLRQKERWYKKFKKIDWHELEAWLKRNRPENNYKKNPVVAKGELYDSEYDTYCKLNQDGELVIGGYYHNSNFERGKPLWVNFNETWKDQFL